jgi:iron uptake system component EfeO
MLRASQTQKLFTSVGAIGVLALVASGYSSPAVAESSPAPIENGAAQVSVTLTADGGGACIVDHATAAAGPVTFAVTNQSATAITEVELLSDNRIVGERENLAPGLPMVSFTATLGGGAYQIYCSGAKQELQDFTVTGKAAAQSTGRPAQILAAGTKGYASYVDGVVDAMATAVDRLKTDVDAGDVAKSKADYAAARPFYERIESDVDGFVLPGFKATDNAGNLDYLIDMRASSLDPKVGWHGFHAVERDLFEKGQITAETKALSAELQKNVDKLDKLVKSLKYKPEDLANGAADLLDEVQKTKITGEEEAFSHYDLVTFAGNVEGAEQAFAFLEPGMTKIDPELTGRVNAQFARVNMLLKSYRDADAPGGYKIFTAELRSSDGAALSKSVQALQEPLSKIAEKVATAH